MDSQIKATPTRLHRTIFTPKKFRATENQINICMDFVRNAKDRSDFEVRTVNEAVGQGLFSTTKFYKGDFLIEYQGELITAEEGKKREINYPDSLGSFLYFFRHKGKELCIDATFWESLGRYINDGIESERNSEVRCVTLHGKPHLVIFATKNIKPNDEIRFDYGSSDLPWRKEEANVSIASKRAKFGSNAVTQLKTITTFKPQDIIFQKKKITQSKPDIIIRECYVRLEKLNIESSKSGTCELGKMSQSNKLNASFPIQKPSIARKEACQKKNESTNVKANQQTNDIALKKGSVYRKIEFRGISSKHSILNLKRKGTFISQQQHIHRHNKNLTKNGAPKVQQKKKTETLHQGMKSIKNIKTKQKPYRPCPYCGKFQSKLRSHLIRKHKNEDAVKSAIHLPKQERDAAFKLLKRKGIMKKNQETLGSGSKNLIVERCRGSSAVIYCSKCLAFIKKSYFHRHKKICYMSHNSTAIPQSMPSSLPCDEKGTTEFQRSILNSFREDDIGHLCRHDKLITAFAKQEFTKVKIHEDKKDEKRKTLKSDMRRLGYLFKTFQDICKEEGITCSSSYDMFKRENIKVLEASINKLSAKNDGSIKNGYKVGMGYLIKRVGKFIQGDLLIKKKDESASEIGNFLSVFHFHWLNTFGDSEYMVMKKRQTNLRKPQNLPLNEDIEKLKEYTNKEIQRISTDAFIFITQREYVLLRDLLVCRLTLFNARRGGEACRLTLGEWADAEKDVWYDKQNLNTGNPQDKLLLGKYKLAYQPGKTGKLVPLLIKDDCWDAMAIITDSEIRLQAGVPESNNFVFPHTQLSDKHAIGWSAVHKCCKLAGCSETVTATRRRHQVSTLYAALDAPESDRKAFLIHMDHGEGINTNVYQTPQAIRETTRVGRFLHRLDSGKFIP